MALLEPNYYGLWVGKQTAKGTPNTSPGKRLVQVGGDFNMPRDDGSENYSDLTKYGDSTDWVNSVAGSGEPVCEATPIELAHMLWLFHGAETVTDEGSVQEHEFVPSSGIGHYFTAFRRVGNAVKQRQQFNDCITTKMVIEGSTANKAVRMTPSILSLDPGEVKTADPAATMPALNPFLYTDGTGSFTIDGTVFRGQSSFQLTIDDAWSVVYADDIHAFDFQQGSPTVAISVTAYFDDVALAHWNELVYGDPAPTAGTKPLAVVPALGSYGLTLAQRDSAGVANGNEFELAIPGVKWQVPDAPGPNPDGGATEVTLAGAMRPVSGQEPYTIDVRLPDAVVAFTA